MKHISILFAIYMAIVGINIATYENFNNVAVLNDQNYVEIMGSHDMTQEEYDLLQAISDAVILSQRLKRKFDKDSFAITQLQYKGYDKDIIYKQQQLRDTLGEEVHNLIDRYTEKYGKWEEVLRPVLQASGYWRSTSHNSKEYISLKTSVEYAQDLVRKTQRSVYKTKHAYEVLDSNKPKECKECIDLYYSYINKIRLLSSYDGISVREGMRIHDKSELEKIEKRMMDSNCNQQLTDSKFFDLLAQLVGVYHYRNINRAIQHLLKTALR